MADRYGSEAELAGDIVETTRKKQNSFDQTNSQQYLRPQQAAQPTAAPVAAGPVGRATQQLPTAPTSSLMDANMPRSAALGGQTSFDSSNTPAQYLNSLSGSQSAPQGLQRQGQSAPFAGVAKANNYSGSLDQFPVSGQGRLIASGTGRAQEPAGAPGDNQFRSTGYGAGAQGGVIAARVGSDGVPEFSNDAAAQRQAASLGSIPSTAPRQPASLNDIPVTRQQSQTEGQTLASLGDVGNLNNGVGTFSQAQPGDAALAMGRWQRAAEIRQDMKNQQRLDRALADQYAQDHTTVVRDSSRPYTRDDMIRESLNQQQTQSTLDNVGLAQSVIAGTQAQRAGDQQLRQAARLEDIQVRAFAPGATQDDRNAFLQAKDPVGYLKNQQDSVTTALNNEKTQLQIDGMRSDQQQKASDRITAKENEAATFDLAIGSIDTLGGVPGDPDRPEHPGLKETFGTFNSLVPTRPGSDSADFQARLDTLKAQTFLPQVAALKGTGGLSDAEGKKLSDSIGALSVKMSAEEFRKSLKEVRQTLVAARERSTKGSVGQQNSPQRTSAGPKPGDTEEGYEFIGGSPASPANWRKI